MPDSLEPWPAAAGSLAAPLLPYFILGPDGDRHRARLAALLLPYSLSLVAGSARSSRIIKVLEQTFHELGAS